LVLVAITAWSQEDVNIKKGAFKTGIDIGFKEAWKSVKLGDGYYKQGMGTYDLARDHYLFAEQYNPNNPELNYKLGACYLFTDNKYEAINYLRKAYTADPEVSGDIHFLLARAYQLVLEFDKATEHYYAHLETLDGPDEKMEYSTRMKKYLTECVNGRELSQKPVRVILQNLGENVNSKYDDYNPIFDAGDSALFFTSRRPYNKSKRNPSDNKFNEDIYRAAFDDKKFDTAFRLNKPFNTKHNNSLVGVSSDGNQLFLYRGDIEGGDIQITEYMDEKGKWSRPKGLSSALSSRDGETSAFLSPEGNELYFISRNKDLSQGGKDILVSRINVKGKWSTPENLSKLINTEYDEEGIFITPDGRFLYFASQGHNSMGGFDIFRSEKLANGAWSNPVNLGYPINTPDDEVFYVTDKTGTFGYYSAIREGGLGAKDIYKVIYLGAEKELIFKTKDQLIAGPNPTKTGFLTAPRLMTIDTTYVVTGRVLDTLAGILPVVAKITFMDAGTGISNAFVISDSTGDYTARLPEGKVYGVEINAAGYLYYLDVLDLSTASNQEKINLNFYLRKVEVGTKVVLNNIYFETGKAILRPESVEALDQVYRFLENNPRIRLEISGHTDNTGSLRINQKLSRDRAKAVVDWLVSKGIPADMLAYEGYADTQPVAPNDTASGRKKNRRVEFKVISK
jgi:outer membrane protein OmpA-like peptidoglycan-associated protein/tetratricopeptide (TPR) repeat protein